MRKFLIILPLLFLFLSCEKEFQEPTVQEPTVQKTGKKIKPNSLMSQNDGPGDGGGTGSGGGDIEEEDNGDVWGSGGSAALISLNSGFVVFEPTTYKIVVNYKRLPNNVLTADGVSIVKIGGPSSMTIINKSYLYNSTENTITFTVMGTIRTIPFGSIIPDLQNFTHTISINTQNSTYTAN